MTHLLSISVAHHSWSDSVSCIVSHHISTPILRHTFYYIKTKSKNRKQRRHPYGVRQAYNTLGGPCVRSVA